MKNILAALTLLTACTASAIQYVDLTTRVTNTVTTTARITVTNHFTNAVYVAVNSNSVTIGDPLSTAFTKVNTNFWELQTSVSVLSNKWSASNSVFSANIAYANADIWSLSNRVRYFQGSNIVAGTVTSNAFDADTWFAMTNGSPSAGGTMDFDSSTITSDGSGNITAVTVKAGLKDSGSDTGTYGYMPVAMGDGTWTWMAGVTITNTVNITNTAYNLSNAWIGSQRTITFTTNNAAWGASNYLARVSGLYSWKLEPGNDGGNPPMTIPMSLVGSYNGSNGWFTITNGFRTTNMISVAAITNGLSARGSARATLGQATLYSVDKWELLGRTNYGFGQFYRFDDPVENDDAATKKYVDTGLANVTDHNFTTSTDTNTTTAHLLYQRYGMTLFDIASRTAWVPLKGISLSGTNLLLDIYQTNLTAGWFIESTTNLALVNSWATWTNYSMATNTGVVTFTTPILPNEEMRFYRGRGNSTNSVTVNAPLVLPITTPASSTATTYGLGAGVVLVDTNYVYVSVGTNAWKRAALSSW